MDCSLPGFTVLWILQARVLECNLYAEYIIRNAGLEEAQAGIKIAGRNINNVRYADDTTVMAESEEELNGLLMKVKEEHEKTGINGNSDRFLLNWASKSLQMVTAAMT